MTVFAFAARRYPTDPGCYLMKDDRGKVIYVGKAKDLRRRLASYFQRRHRQRRLRRLVERVRAVEVMLVNNETESLVLENNLIKLHRPPFNRALMRTGSGYPYIILTDEKFPRLLPYHKDQFNPALARAGQIAVERRFGPYLNRRFRDVILEFANENFGLRTCQPLPRQVCLLYHMGRCGGPCEGKIFQKDYQRAVADAAAFLASAQHTDLVREMRQRMWVYAEQLEFERARRIRDQIEALTSMLDRQIVERDLDYDQDVIYFGQAHGLVMEIKQGALQKMALLDLGRYSADAAPTTAFLFDRYCRASPPELIVNRLEGLTEAEHTLSTAQGQPVRILLPIDGIAAELLKLGERNYHYRLSDLMNAAEARIA